MKTIFRFLRILFAVLLVIAALLAWSYYHSTGLLKEARAYVQEVFPVIFSNWKTMELYDRCSPEYKKSMTLDQTY